MTSLRSLGLARARIHIHDCARALTPHGVRVGPMYVLYNNVLRNYKTSRGQYVTTIHALNSAVVKLSRIQPAGTVYR